MVLYKIHASGIRGILHYGWEPNENDNLIVTYENFCLWIEKTDKDGRQRVGSVPTEFQRCFKEFLSLGGRISVEWVSNIPRKHPSNVKGVELPCIYSIEGAKLKHLVKAIDEIKEAVEQASKVDDKVWLEVVNSSQSKKQSKAPPSNKDSKETVGKKRKVPTPESDMTGNKKIKRNPVININSEETNTASPMSAMNRVFAVLVKCLDPEPVLDNLLDLGFPFEKIRDIRDERLTSDRNRVLIKEVQKRGDEAYLKFKKSLQQSEQKMICSLLEKTERGESTADLQQRLLFNAQKHMKFKQEIHRLFKERMFPNICFDDIFF